MYYSLHIDCDFLLGKFVLSTDILVNRVHVHWVHMKDTYLVANVSSHSRGKRLETLSTESHYGCIHLAGVSGNMINDTIEIYVLYRYN